MKASASSPSIATNSLMGHQGSNSIRSQLTSPAESDWMVRATWTPPSPPAPSSARTEQTDQSLHRVPSLPMPAMPATGLRLSPCNSATSQKALAANLARSVVPGLDLTRVHMGFDDDEDTEDDITNKLGKAPSGGDEVTSSGGWKAEVPQLDMSAVQIDGASNSCPSKESSAVVQAPRDASDPACGKVALSNASLQKECIQVGGDYMPQEARDFQSLQKNRARTPERATGYPDPHYGYTLGVDTAGHVVAGAQRKVAGGGKKVSVEAPVGIRLPPVGKPTKGQKSKLVSHVHMHHHLHYHVNRAAAESYS